MCCHTDTKNDLSMRIYWHNLDKGERHTTELILWVTTPQHHSLANTSKLVSLSSSRLSKGSKDLDSAQEKIKTSAHPQQAKI